MPGRRRQDTARPSTICRRSRGPGRRRRCSRAGSRTGHRPRGLIELSSWEVRGALILSAPRALAYTGGFWARTRGRLPAKQREEGTARRGRPVRGRIGRASPRDAGSGRVARRGRDGVIGAVRYALTVVEEPPECAGVRHRAVVRAGPIGVALAAEWHGLERKYVAGTGLAAHPAVHVRRPAVADTVVVHVVVQAPA